MVQKSFKDSVNEKEKFFGINPTKAARIAKWNALKEAVRHEWQKTSMNRALSTAFVIGSVSLIGALGYYSTCAKIIDRETELNANITRSLVYDAMQRKADRAATRYIEIYNLKDEMARGIRGYVDSEVMKKWNLRSDLSYLDAKVKKIILMTREGEKEEARKKKGEQNAAAAKAKLPQEVKKQIGELEYSIGKCNEEIKQLRVHKYDSTGQKDPETFAKMAEVAKRIENYNEMIYGLDPSMRPATLFTNPQAPQAKREETKVLFGNVVRIEMYEFPISKSYEVSRIRSNARSGNTEVEDFERIQISDMCNFPFSLIMVEKGLSDHIVLVPHTAFRSGCKVNLTVKAITGKRISYQQIIDLTLGSGYKAMQNAEVSADFIAIEGKEIY